MEVQDVTDKSQWEAVVTQPLVLLECFAKWCGPCKVLAPHVVKFSNVYTNVAFYKLDVDELPDLANELSIRSLPTVILFENGKPVDTVVGVNFKDIEAKLQRLASSKIQVETEKPQ